MREDKCKAIEEYLSRKMPGLDIQQKNDFSLGARTYKILVPSGDLLLKISDEFIDDNDIADITRKLDRWNIIEELSNKYQLGILVTQNGISTFNRE